MIQEAGGPNVQVKINLPDIIIKRGEAGRLVDYAIAAALEIVVTEYVDQSPRNIGHLVGEIRPKKVGPLDYMVESRAGNASRDSKGRTYPENLFTGTGKLRGAPDYGYTPGRVRAGDVAFGIGGIRPNKAATRAKNRAEPRFMRKLQQLVNTKIRQS